MSMPRTPRNAFGTAIAVLLIGGLYLPAGVAYAAAPPTLPISQVPLTVVQPTSPQVLFAVGNSQSMDGDLSGAILTGSGALSSTYSSLSASTSPTDYTIPGGFAPPVTPTLLPPNPPQNLALPVGCAMAAAPVGEAPYTTSCGGTLYDTSASRLNVAKEGLLEILNQYMATTNFALMDYSTSGTSLYSTWVYYMSNPGGFTFSLNNTTVLASGEYVANPCYNYTAATTSSQVNSDCTSIAGSGLYTSSDVLNDPYMVVGASSDDADINDVLYDTGGLAVYVDYGAVSPASPFPPSPPGDTLLDYEGGSVFLTYPSVVPAGGARETGPTNAGYVPYSTQVMYSKRGFGYYVSTVTATTGNTVVGMTSAGASPTSATTNTAINAFVPALAPETNAGTSEIKALAYQSPLAGLMAGAQTLLAGSLGITPPGCAKPKQYVVLITDGLPTMDLNHRNWPPLGSAAAAGYNVTATFNADGSLASTNDQALTDTINNIQALSAAGIETYVVGLGAGVDSPTSQAGLALSAMAVAGGSAAKASSITGSTQYFPATTPATLVQDLQSILADVEGQTSASSSAAANSTSLGTNADIFQATFTPGTSVDNAWTGDLKVYPISASAVIGAFGWSAQTQLDAQVASAGFASRNIATWDPYQGAGPTAEPFIWSSLSSTLQTELEQDGNNGPNLLAYISGDQSNEQTVANPTGVFRQRASLLGDIVDSSPVYVGTPNESYPDLSYAAFAVAQASRTPMLYVGANDGMLHGINATAPPPLTANGGNEVMAFIPNGGAHGVFDNLYLLASPFYFFHHQFYVDGSPQVTDVILSDGQWHSLLVGGENAGGSSIYAIDVTNPGSFTTPIAVASAVKWEFTDPDMGLSYSTPTIVRSNAVTVTDAANHVATNGFAVLFGNGYNSPSGRPYFYAVDASTGTIIAKIDLCNAPGVPAGTCNATLANGLSSISAANSSGVIGVPQDMAYAGDLQGNLWSINMSSATPANWTVSLLFQARDSLGNPQPITSAPALTPNPNFPLEFGLMAYFGTGELLTQADLTNSNTQSFYGVWDNTADLANYHSPTPTPVPPYTRSNLQSQTVTAETVSISGLSVQALVSTNYPVNLSYAPISVANIPPPGTTPYNPVEGWYFDLSSIKSGTRVFTNAQVESGGVLFATATPPATACDKPESYLMNVSFSTGGPLALPSIGTVGGGTTIGGATAGGSAVIITGMFVSQSYTSAPTSVITPMGTTAQILNCSGQPCEITTAGNKPNRVGWWQIQ